MSNFNPEEHFSSDIHKQICPNCKKLESINTDLLRSLEKIIGLADKGEIVENEPSHYMPLIFDEARNLVNKAKGEK
ncbi:MAG: hypothetical protein GY804_09910 [Alphaproteobacteria bacterium]|nr:hypothetical protein [Alphaproteobacteria bacterium]